LRLLAVDGDGGANLGRRYGEGALNGRFALQSRRAERLGRSAQTLSAERFDMLSSKGPGGRWGWMEVEAPENGDVIVAQFQAPSWEKADAAWDESSAGGGEGDAGDELGERGKVPYPSGLWRMAAADRSNLLAIENLDRDAGVMIAMFPDDLTKNRRLDGLRPAALKWRGP